MEGIQVFEHHVGFQNDIIYLKVSGYIDTSTSIELVNKLKVILDKNFVQFVIDLGGVNYVSSAGWGVFVGEIKNIREQGGDIKLVNMNPDVYDVFQMLEFDKILRTCDSIEEAINEFDLLRGFDITSSPVKDSPADSVAAKTIADIQISRIVAEKNVSHKVGGSLWTKHKTEPINLPVAEKIKHIVAKKPSINVWGIKKKLNTETYGHTKINYFKLTRLLKELKLDSKEERHRFYRSR